MSNSLQRDLVLVVSANTQERVRSMALLRSSGYAAASVATSAKALEYLRNRPGCRLVLASVFLPGESGFVLLDKITLEFADVGVILTTSPQRIEIAVQAFRRGAADVLMEPFSLSALRSSVASALMQGQMRQETLRYLRSLETLVNERTGKLRQIMEDLERSYDVTIEAMGDALDMRDEETEGHSKRVTAYTVALAREMRLNQAELKTIARGAFLHDIGKIAIPDSILLKPGKLTPEEMCIMQSHCERGYRIVRKIPFLTEAAQIVYAHQERFDGTGYPRGLRGKSIPLGARIFAVADTLDAMTSDRPYRRALTFRDAAREIVRGSGEQFDPAVVNAFLAVPEGTWPIIRAEVGRQTHAAELVRSAANAAVA
ncbi:MAG: HD domain-containing protein [Acidobacteriaceae bacterium]|nr:HD domain-containing protein [Acidobacteriaceae bacterium]